MDWIARGSPESIIPADETASLLDTLVAGLRARGPLRRVLLIPPDITRLHSGAGPLTAGLYRRLAPDAEVVVLPALGTHTPMTAAERERMFPGVPAARFRDHDWRNGVVDLGEVPTDFFARVSEGRLHCSARVLVNRLLVEEPWDAIISVGQLVPHEVVGIANHAKNILIGVGGSDLIHKSHWLGAVHGMERMMGRTDTPVRAVLDYALGRFLGHLPLVWLLTVRGKDAGGEVVTRGLFAGDGRACFERGADLARRVNLDALDEAPAKVVVYLDPDEFRSTWLGNKAVYRTRMAIADGGELVVLAPGVREFGEDTAIDALIRRFGYRGTPATLSAVEEFPELARNLSAAAHLIHGSTEGRFRVTYCPGRLSRAEVEGAGYGYGDLGDALERYNPERLPDGWNEVFGERIFYVSNPGLGLWGTRERFGL